MAASPAPASAAGTAAWEAVIGLEVHVQLATRTKLFCGCPQRFGDPPNTNVCPVCLGHPGTLPVLNRAAVDLAVRMALAVGCTVNPRSRFARKNYFYPDLPKGYQISQYDEPLATGGFLEIDIASSSGSGSSSGAGPGSGAGAGTAKRIGITRIHMEEDAGKLFHDAGTGGASLVDFNRAGVPLIECVSEPDLRSAAEAYEYLTELKAVVQYTGASLANMEEGSLRCDANVSLRPAGERAFGTRAELKNMNSFRNVERAITFEIERQRALLEAGGRVVQETRLWDAAKGETFTMRSKEEAHDYRYFPEPDLLPLEIPEAGLEETRRKLPELPRARWDRFCRELGIARGDARILTLDRELGDYLEAAVAAGGSPREVANWVLRDVLRWTRESARPVREFPVKAAELAELTRLVGSGSISSAQAKAVFEEMVATGKPASAIVAEKGLAQVSDTAAIEAAVHRVIAANPSEVERYRAGKKGLLGFLVGQAMKEMKGQGNPKLVSAIVTRELDGAGS